MPPMNPAGPPADPDLRERLLGAIPALRAFAHSLADDGERGDALVQDTLLRAWTGLDGAAGGDATAWLFAILRARFHAERRSGPGPAGDDGGPPTPEGPPETLRFREALRRLPDAQREALILVGGQRFTYGEAAAICGVAVGTLKSRVFRARARLAADLDPHPGRGPPASGNR